MILEDIARILGLLVDPRHQQTFQKRQGGLREQVGELRVPGEEPASTGRGEQVVPELGIPPPWSAARPNCCRLPSSAKTES